MITSFVVLTGTYGSMDFKADGVSLTITLTEEECRPLQALAEQIWEARHGKIAEIVGRPLAQLAHFEEINNDSDIPF